ncbi:hypothetical protein FACS1894188_08420 [Clostridia bacterium]|nr:hypothetical protein FACS1894188_08420 [Clostridia bacterium]
MEKFIDLNIHTIYSDGEHTPQEVVDLAVENGLSAIAISDHNCVDGIEIAIRYAINKSIEIVPAVELSTELTLEDYNSIYKLCIVGLYVNWYDSELVKKYPLMQVSPQEIISLIHNAGGVAIWAHPLDSIAYRSLTVEEFEFESLQLDKIAQLLYKSKLDGIETNYPSYNAVCESFLNKANWVKKYSYIESGGSNFYGKSYANKIGIGKFNTKIPYSVLNKIKEYRLVTHLKLNSISAINTDILKCVRNEVDILVSKVIPKDQISYFTYHLYTVSCFCNLLALKRGLNPEISAVAGMLHDIHQVVAGTVINHAKLGSEDALVILQALGLYENDEIDTITKAIRSHSNKERLDGQFEELLKDADVMSHCFHTTRRLSYPLGEFEIKRCESIMREFGFMEDLIHSFVDSTLK